MFARSKVLRQADVDPYASDESDDTRQQRLKDEEKKRAALRQRRQAAQRAERELQQRGGPPPKLRDGGDAVVSVESTALLEHNAAENLRLHVATVDSAELKLPVTAGAGPSHVYARATAAAANKVQEKFSEVTSYFDDKGGRATMRYCDIAGLSFEMLPVVGGDDFFLMSSSGANSTAALTPVDTLFNCVPYIEDAAQHQDGESIFAAMRKRNFRAGMGTAGDTKVRLTKAEVGLFKSYCKKYAFDTLDGDRFAQVWADVKAATYNQKASRADPEAAVEEVSHDPPPTVVIMIFGNATKASLGVDDVELLLYQTGLVEGGNIAFTSVEELAAKQYTAQNKDELDEEEFQDMDQGEKHFDDDDEDKHWLNPDHANVDATTKKWADDTEAGKKDIRTVDLDDDSDDSGGGGKAAPAAPAAAPAAAGSGATSRKRPADASDAPATRRRRG